MLQDFGLKTYSPTCFHPNWDLSRAALVPVCSSDLIFPITIDHECLVHQSCKNLALIIHRVQNTKDHDHN